MGAKLLKRLVSLWPLTAERVCAPSQLAHTPAPIFRGETPPSYHARHRRQGPQQGLHDATEAPAVRKRGLGGCPVKLPAACASPPQPLPGQRPRGSTPAGTPGTAPRPAGTQPVPAVCGWARRRHGGGGPALARALVRSLTLINGLERAGEVAVLPTAVHLAPQRRRRRPRAARRRHLGTGRRHTSGGRRPRLPRKRKGRALRPPRR